MTAAAAPWLLAGIPLAGALLSLFAWANAARLRTSAVLVSAITFGAAIGLTGRLASPPEGALLLYLLPVAACVSLLGQPLHHDHRLSWVATLLLLGLGLGVLALPTIGGPLFLMLLLGCLIALLYRYHTPLWPISWLGIGTYGFGAMCAAVSMIAGRPFSAAASLLACATLLPLVPFHEGHVTSITRLPGSLPSFIVLLLPALGLHGLVAVLPAAPGPIAWIVTLLAMAGSLYGAVKALAQSRVRLLLAYGSLSFFSMVWWFAASAGHATSQASVFIGAAGFATSGLLLAWQVIRTRYGDDVDPQAISGLAFTMPRYAVLLSLLALAAMGLPPFGVFAAFMGLFLNTPISSALGPFIMLLAWLTASWYVMRMAQQLLFGTRRSDLRYADLIHTEFASLFIVVLVLLALGVTPSNLFAPARNAPSATMDSIAWQK